MKYFILKTAIGISVTFSAFTAQAHAMADELPSAASAFTVPYEMHVDYKSLMHACALLGSETSLCDGSIFEKQRNAKLKALGRHDEVTYYFDPSKSSNDILIEMVADYIREIYSVAGDVYEYLAKEGYSDVAIAAILGNMMNECGGNTLNFQPFIYDQSGLHYGLCQWNIRYSPKVNGCNVEEQLGYLTSTIEKNMKQFGGSFEEFNSLEDAEYAATYFCKYYERGANARQRGLNAIVVYELIQEFK